MAKQQTYDATKMGPLSWRQLQLANQNYYANLEPGDDLRAIMEANTVKAIPNSGSPELNWEGRVQSPIMRNSNGRDYWGKSIWDEQVADANDFYNNLSDLRGQNQPWYAQLGAGLLKGVTTFATTWLDGIVGLLYGAYKAGLSPDDKTGWDRAALLFHNSVSDSLQDFNEFMEEFAPNYKSRDEENNKWYQNMGTMNFWADGLIKNLGFTVGAFYSGSIFTKALKGAGGLIAAGKAGKAAKAYKAGKVKELIDAGMSAEEAAKAVNPMATATRYTNTLKAIEGARSGTGIAVAGSLFSAVNEGRIEANQVYRDAFTLGNTPEESKGAAAEILAARNKKMQEIEDDQTLLPSEKQALQSQVQANSQKLLAEAEQNAAKAGMLTLGLNIPILTIDNFKMYGRLYSRGFKQSVKQVSNNVTTQELKAAQDAVKNATTKQEKEAAKRALKEAERKAKAAHNARNNARIDDVAENVTEKEGRLAWNEITKGQAAWKGIKQGLMEGNEEMMQAWASGTAGNMTMPEDPDAYYKALTDPNATVKTNDFLTSVTKGFLDSYGNGDRWEEGAIGFLTGILGMPTFGARANSDSNTYLGRGKMIGLSGGLFGEFSNANYLNRLGVESVKNLNAFRDKYKQHAQFLAQSQAFTDAMDGYLQDKNEFAYNNARDNDDYAMIQALAVTGRIDEVKAMLNFKEEDLTDEILDSIANDFTENSNLVDSDGNPKTVDDNGKPLQGAWRDKAGNLMSRTKEGKAEMKAKLLEKQKRLNEEIDDYVASLDSVRAQVNNSLDESQVRELAWLDWKNKQWSRRFQDMQGEQAKAFELLINKATDEMKDLKPESDAYKALSNFKELIEKAQKAKSPIELLAALAKNNAFLNVMSKKVGKVAVEQEGGIYQIADEFLGDLITSDEEGLSAIETVGKALGDIRLMAIAQKQFKEKLDEYTSNPAKLAANRQKIENERQQQRDVTDTINQTSELSSKKLRDFLDMDDDAFDTAAQNSILAEMEGVDLSTKENKAAFEEAKKIRKKRQDLLNKINSSDKLNAEQKKNAVALIQAAYNSATSLTNFTTLSNEAYNDPNNVPIPNKESMSSDEIAKYQQDVVDSMQQVLGSIINEDDSALDLPSTEEAKEAAENGVEAEFNFNDEHNTTGNSKVATPSESENERVERENEEKAKKEADKKRKDELNNFIEELTEVFGPKDKRDKAKTFLWDIANGFISSYLKEGEFPKKDQSVNGAKASNAFNGLLSLCENDSQTDWVNSVIIEKLYDKVRQLYDPIAIAQAEKEEQEKAKREQKKQDKERENPVTVVLIESTADDIANKISNKVNKEQKDWQKEHQYWKHTTTEYGIGEKAYEKGNYTKFSDRAQSMDYSPKLKKKIAAVAKYFEDNGVWDRINSGDNGKIAAGRKVGFKIDPKLNEDAGEVIVLLTDEDGNIIGDLDSRATNQANLPKFVEYVKNQFEKFSAEHKGEVFVLTQPNSNRTLVTKITQCMIGKVPYGDEYITLNEANDTNIDDDNENHKYYLGIAVADADGNVRVKATAQKVGSLGYIDRQIKQPIIEKNDGLVAGTPYLLVKSEGSNSYMCVPIITPTFDSEHYDEIMNNSAYGFVIRKYIGDIEAIVKNQGPAYKNLTQEQKPFRIKEILNDLFVGKFYVEYNKSNNTYTFKVNNSDFYANVSFEDEAPEGTNKFSVEDLLQSISGHSLGLQISRKYINGNNPRYNENGQQINFNKAIGSIAKVNIMPMSRLQKQDGQHTSYLHTVDDWFTLNPLLVSTDVSGKVTIKAQEVEAPVSVGSNRTPKAVTNMTLTTTIKDEKTGENKETTMRVSVDYEGKSVTINERKIPVDSKNTNKNLLKIARTAYAIEKARREGATKTVETSWGTFDLKTNTFVNDNTISYAGLDDDLFNTIAADNAQIQAESTSTTEQQPAVETKQETSTLDNITDFSVLDIQNVSYGSSKNPRKGTYKARKKENGIINTVNAKGEHIQQVDDVGDQIEFFIEDKKRNLRLEAKDFVISEPILEEDANGIVYDRTIGTHQDLLDELVEKGYDTSTFLATRLFRDLQTGKWYAEGQFGTGLMKADARVELSPDFNLAAAMSAHANSINRKYGQNTTQTSEQQSTTSQVNEQASSTEIAQQEETVQESTPQETKQEVEQNPVENTVQLPTVQEVLEAKPEEVEKAAKELYTDICGKNGEKIYDALTPEQRSAIANSDSQDAILERLRDEFKKGKFKKDVDSIIAEYDTKYSRVTEEEREVWDREKELAWLKKALPQLSNEQRVQIVDGLIKIKNSDNPGYAWGQFCRGLITISSEAASGTLYHEAFHAVIDLLMTEDEYNKLFDAAYQVWGNLGMLGLEEKLAEEFRKFVQYGDNAAFVDYDAEGIKTPIIRGIVRLFRRLKALIQGLSNKQIYLNKLFYDINKGKFADRKIKENKLDKVTTRQEEDAQLVLDRNPELASVGTAREYAAYINDIFPNSVEKDIYWHGSNEDFSDGFNTAKRGEGSGALETKKRNDLYLNRQGWASLQYVNGVNRQGSDKNGFAHWNKLWWELKEIMSNGRRENNDWKDIVITNKDANSIRQAIPNKRGKFDRDKGGTHGKWLKERKADYGYENKSDKEFFEEVFGLQLGKDTFNTWTARNAEVFKAMETTAKGIYPVVINVTNPIVEEGQNTYYEEQRGLFSQADRNGNDAILSRKADNEFNSDVAVVINANNKNVHWLGTKSDVEQFRQWKEHNKNKLGLEDIRYFLGKNLRREIEARLKKSRPDMQQEEINSVLDFLHSLQDTKEDNAYIRTAVTWILNKSITLPEDYEKTRQIFDVARKKHVDIQKYKTFGELMASPEMRKREKEKKVFDPDKAKTFSNKHTVTTEGGRVFTVYDVENTEEGQRDVCHALAAHYESSPWCLSTFTKTGEPTESAKGYWKHYNAIPRKIAFENGRPVAFSSTDRTTKTPESVRSLIDSTEALIKRKESEKQDAELLVEKLEKLSKQEIELTPENVPGLLEGNIFGLYYTTLKKPNGETILKISELDKEARYSKNSKSLVLKPDNTIVTSDWTLPLAEELEADGKIKFVSKNSYGYNVYSVTEEGQKLFSRKADRLVDNGIVEKRQDDYILTQKGAKKLFGNKWDKITAARKQEYFGRLSQARKNLDSIERDVENANNNLVSYKAELEKIESKGYSKEAWWDMEDKYSQAKLSDSISANVRTSIIQHRQLQTVRDVFPDMPDSITSLNEAEDWAIATHPEVFERLNPQYVNDNNGLMGAVWNQHEAERLDAYDNRIRAVFTNLIEQSGGHFSQDVINEFDSFYEYMTDGISNEERDAELTRFADRHNLFDGHIERLMDLYGEAVQYVNSHTADDITAMLNTENTAAVMYRRVETELDNKVVEFAEAINKSIAETVALNRYAQNWDYANKGIPVKKPDASDNDGRKAYFGIKNPMHFYKGQWTISNGAAKYGGKDYHEVVKNEVFRRLAMVDMLDKFNALFDVTWNDATNHYVINLKSPEKIATLSEIVDFDSIPDDVLADMAEEDNKKAEAREKEILDGATKHTTTLFEGKTKIGLGKLFENMISAGVNRNKVALYRNILDRLGELKNIEVEISDNKDSRFSNGRAAGWYFPSDNNIALLNNLDDSFLEDSIVHEALHAVVANTVKDKEKSDKVVAIVEGIKKAVLEEYGVKSINDIQDSGTRRLFYGLTNADEFISEFFSNSQFHDYVKNKQATWYNRFIDFIKSILGLDVDITKVVKDLLSDFNGQTQEVRQTISMQNQLGTIFRDIADLSKQAVRPQESTEKQEPSIKQYHIQNLMYENLSEEDKEYIKEKGLSEEEYDNFSMTEKENLWYCR